MPAGVSWGQYLKFLSCATLSMMAGSQMVHMYYKPLQDLDAYIENEMKYARELGVIDGAVIMEKNNSDAKNKAT